MTSTFIVDQFPSLQVSFDIDIKTNGAREGLIFSTGLFTADTKNTTTTTDGYFWLPLYRPVHFQNPLQSEEVINGQFDCRRSSANSPADECSKEMLALKRGSPEGGDRCEFMPEPAIQLNLFEDDRKQQQLVPLLSGPSRGDLLTQFDDPPPPPHLPHPAHPNPELLCDSTTTTTTLEIFRPRVEECDDFFQLPRGPLSFEKEPVLLVPSRGKEYERAERSETRFEERNRQMMEEALPSPQQPQGQKSVQWGDSISIGPSSSSLTQTPTFPANSPSRVPFSPPQQASTPILIIRQQQQEHSEHTLISPPAAKCPPRPLKRRHQGTKKMAENAVPPRPPKPEHLKQAIREKWDGMQPTICTTPKRSQSADPMESVDGKGQQEMLRRQGQYRGPVRSASSNQIFKLYQTRDCLGRVVCEW